MQSEYWIQGWKFHHKQQLEFEEPADGSTPTITLHIDEESSSLDGWKVDYLSPPKVRSLLITSSLVWSHCSVHTCICLQQVEKDKVDKMYAESRPRCQLVFSWKGKSKRLFPAVSRRVDLEGAKRPYHYFTIYLPATGSVLTKGKKICKN